MKRPVLTLLSALAFGPSLNPMLPQKTGLANCDVRGVYKSVEMPAGALGVSGSSDPKEIDSVLVPTTLSAGTYSVSVTRKGQDIYLIETTDLYLRTFACYDYSFSKKAVLRYQGGQYIGAGKLVFE